jgi:Domain of unknown function (DUF6798)
VSSTRRPYLYLALLTTGALLVHGYHPAVEDAEIYMPGIKKLLNPDLYPFCAEFFLDHARLTFFDELIAASVRISHLPFDLTIFIWYAASVCLTLTACWQLCVECFETSEARWAGVATVAALLTIPVAGTSLYIADQYLTARSIVTFAVLFTISNTIRGRTTMAALWAVFAACMHPLMAVFGISYAIVLWRTKHREPSIKMAYQLLPAPFVANDLLPMPSHAYQQAVATRSYFFLLQWQWYEWLGALAPFLLLWGIARVSERGSSRTMRMMSHGLIMYGIPYLLLAILITVPARFQTSARYQPMRSLHLLYIIMFLLVGGLIGQYFLKRHAWRWIALFLPLCAVMFFAQRQLFPRSPHLELPGRAAANDWVQAFEWVRDNTPADALFAVDPEYMIKNDQHGFRVIAERSRLADAVKDSGAVTMFPELPAADDWLEQLNSESGWQQFREGDFRRLERTYGVSWIVAERTLDLNFRCPFENQTIRVCRLD